MFEYYVKINKVGICIKFEKQVVEKYLNNEFSRYRCLENKINDLEISILDEVFLIPNKASLNSRNLYFEKNMVYQRIDAKFRKTWIKYEITNREVTNITVFLPTPKLIYNFVFKLISRNSLGVIENSLVDFFHGPFLGFMQFNFLKYGSTFIHASSILYNNFGIIFLGKAQSGKTTLVNQILRNDLNAKFISEDLTITDTNSNLFSYHKQASIVEKSKLSNRFLEKINIENVFKYKKKLVKMQDLYDEVQIIDGHKLDYIFIVDRYHQNTIIQEYSLTETINFAIDVMNNELLNFNGFYEVIILIDSLHNNNQLDKLNVKMRKIYEDALKDKIIFKLNLKEYVDIKDIYEDVDAIIRRLFEEKS